MIFSSRTRIASNARQRDRLLCFVRQNAILPQ